MTTLILICTLLLLMSYELSRHEWFSPGVLTCGVWLVGLVLFVVMPHPLPPLSMRFLMGAGLWIALYTVSALCMQSFSYRAQETQMSALVYDVYYWISICCIPFLIYFVYQALRFGTTDNWAMNLRMAALGRGRFSHDGTYTPLYYTLWQVTYLLALFRLDKAHWRRAVVMGLLVLGFGVATMAKFVLLFFGVVTIVMLYQKHIIRLRHIAVIGLILITGMFVQHAVREKMEYDQKTFFEVVELYVLRNYTAFDTVEPCSSEHWGENVFRFCYAVAYKLGWSTVEPIDPLLPFIHKPTFTNTYTCLYPFYKDFGMWGIGLGAVITGAFMGWIFRKKQQGSTFFTLLFVYFCTTIIIQYNSEFLFMNFSGHVKACLLLYIPFLISRIPKHE